MDKYIVKNGKKLKYGFTTGSCAAGAAKAVTKMLFCKEKIDEIEIDTPKGWKLNLSLDDIEISDNSVTCCIVKDSGDDPDITNGMKIYAKASKTDTPGINITGGIGVGKVTKVGLSVDVGEYAINPTPMQMIKDEVSKVLPKGEGVNITIYAPEGVEIAKRTFNPKLGIIGGISIIGTTGIVEPMSEDAFKESLSIELKMANRDGYKKALFSPGNYGRDYSLKLGISDEIIFKTSNFIGFMLDEAVKHGIKEILWVGHIGKMIKVAGGIFNTHSRISDGRMEILAANCALNNCSQNLVEKIMDSITTEEAIDYILEENLGQVFNIIAQKISDRCEKYSYDQLKIGTIIFSQKHGKLGSCSYSEKLLEELK